MWLFTTLIWQLELTTNKRGSCNTVWVITRCSNALS